MSQDCYGLQHFQLNVPLVADELSPPSVKQQDHPWLSVVAPFFVC